MLLAQPKSKVNDGPRVRSRVGMNNEYIAPPSIVGAPTVSAYSGNAPSSPSYQGGAEYALDIHRQVFQAYYMRQSYGSANVYVYATSVLRSIWFSNLMNPNADVSLDAISSTVKSLLEDINSVGPERLPLSEINSANGRPEHMVAVLRASFPWRNSIPHWHEVQAKIRQNLAARDFDVNRLMKGLDR